MKIALVHQALGDIDITIATKPAEKQHGADWEWWFTKGGRGVSFRVQAKRLFPDGTYRSLFKPPPNPYSQLDTLVQVANRDGHIPLYCFFNFDQTLGYFHNWKGQCPHSYRGPSFWGCALADPHEVRSKASNKFMDLRSIMYPWHKLVCDHFPHRRSLPEATIDFIMEADERRRRGRARPELQDVPDRIIEFVETKRSRIRSAENDITEYLDFAFYEEQDEEVPIEGERMAYDMLEKDDPAGLIVFEDRRDG